MFRDYLYEFRSDHSVFLKKILFLVFISISVMSCLTPKKLDKWVDQHYQELEQPQKNNNKVITNNYLVVKSNVPSSGDRYSNSQKVSSYFLPLLFYYKFDFRLSSTINPKISVDNFTRTVLSYSNKKGLKQKLNGRTVELSLDSIPYVVDSDDKGYFIWVILFGFGQEAISVQPQTRNMVVSYKIADNGALIKSGIITVPDVSKPVYLKEFHSRKKMTWGSLEKRDDNIAAGSRAVIDQLITKL